MQTFSDIAADFERKAKEARDKKRQADFKDTAHFYGALAEIIPTFPDGYTQYFDAAATQLDHRAEECRVIAGGVRNADCRAKLLRLAETYQKLSDETKALPSMMSTPSRRPEGSQKVSQ